MPRKNRQVRKKEVSVIHTNVSSTGLKQVTENNLFKTIKSKKVLVIERIRGVSNIPNISKNYPLTNIAKNFLVKVAAPDSVCKWLFITKINKVNRIDKEREGPQLTMSPVVMMPFYFRSNCGTSDHGPQRCVSPPPSGLV